MDGPQIVTDIDHQYAGIWLVGPDNQILGQRRDQKPTIDHPGEVASFGGGIEGAETPQEAAVRELEEETNLTIDASRLVFFVQDIDRRDMTGQVVVRYFYHYILTEDELEKLKVYEGQGAYVLQDSQDDLVIYHWRPIVHVLEKELQLIH